VLLSTYFIYNSIGQLREEDLSHLGLVAHLAQNIQVSASEEEEGNDFYSLALYTPKFLWILRDCVLNEHDSNGNRLTPDQYLQKWLTDTKQLRATSE